MKIENLAAGKIIPYERNAKKHDDRQVENVKESIRQFGFAQPLVVDKDNVLIIGHCRLTAAKRLGLKRVPVVRMDDLTPEEVDRLRLLDNKLNESPWDFELLAEDIPKLDWSGFDIDWEIPGQEEEGEIQEVEAPAPPKNPKTKLGEIWKLGRHRLIIGDSTDPEVVKKLMDGKQADMLLTDPPYNVDYTGKTKDALKISNDKMQDTRFREFLKDAFISAGESLKPGGAFYVWHADLEGYNFRGAARDAGWTIRQCLVWVKNHFVMGRQDYQWQHEPCLYGWKDGGAHYFINSRTEVTVQEEPQPDIEKMTKEELREYIKALREEKTQTTIIREKRPAASALHPTMKPVALMARLIRNSTKPGESVLDTFAGSGSTLIAADQLNRTAYLCEVDPHYADVIIERWEKLTGDKAVKA